MKVLFNITAVLFIIYLVLSCNNPERPLLFEGRSNALLRSIIVSAGSIEPAFIKEGRSNNDSFL